MIKITETNNNSSFATNRRNFIRNSALSIAGIALLRNKVFAMADEMGLKDLYKDDFLMGCAIGGRTLMGEDSGLRDLIAREFNSITSENAMKWASIHPKENEWKFEEPDRLIEYAEKNKMHVQGHVLVWHSQVPREIFVGPDGNQASKELLMKRMETHIQTVVDRYKGKVHSWDVVNESITPEDGFRKSKWLEICGPEFMERAFQLAHEADPKCQLIYNDYNEEDPKRRDFIIELAKEYKKKGIQMHGMGMQAHLNLDSPDLKLWEQAIEMYAAAGLRISITELEVDVLPYDWGRSAEISTNAAYRETLNPYKDGLPKEIDDKLTKRYEEIFKILLKHRDKIDRVTFWGASDDVSWKNNFPMRGRTNYPLLFDRQHKPKNAYFAVAGLKK
jgi:endo-1,4-beta-xylanase